MNNVKVLQFIDLTESNDSNDIAILYPFSRRVEKSADMTSCAEFGIRRPKKREPKGD